MSIIKRFIEGFKKEHIIIQILAILTIIFFIYEIIIFPKSSVIFTALLFLLLVAKFVDWFFNKK